MDKAKVFKLDTSKIVRFDFYLKKTPVIGKSGCMIQTFIFHFSGWLSIKLQFDQR